MQLSDEARRLPGLGMARPGALANLGIETVADLIHHFPRRHEDRRSFRPIDSLRENETAIVRGRIEHVRDARMRRGLSYVQATLCDESGSIEVRWWNQPWLRKTLSSDMELVLFGRVKKAMITGPEYEVVKGEDSLHVGRIVPIYPLTRGVSGPGLRRAIFIALDRVGEAIPDPLPPSILGKRGLPPLGKALCDVHFPENRDALERAKERLRYDELFFFELAVALQRSRVRKQTGIAHKYSAKLDSRIRARLPFDLTAAQDRVVGEIVEDLKAPEPMGRLLQGDVGSGKTAVALYASLVVVANRSQVAFLAPTEILARQHVRTVGHLLQGSEVKVELLVGSTPASERKRLLAGLAAGEVDLIVGTHALLEPSVEFARLGLGVAQVRGRPARRPDPQGGAARRPRHDRHADSPDARTHRLW
ncbi:MAG: DEAD/DEAH box helicase [Planctomycetota bacterium]|jgi:ATP-dependent DNA helicase RecG